MGDQLSGATEHWVPDWLTAPIESIRSDRIELDVATSVNDLHARFAASIRDSIREANRRRGRCCLILPVGPTAHYPYCARLLREAEIDVSTTTIVHMDEYLDARGQWLDEHHPLSFRGVMERQFYDQLSARPTVVFPDPEDPGGVERAIAAAGGVDVAFGGIGIHGHVAFNEPDPAVPADTLASLPPRVVRLNDETVVMNASRAFGGWIDGFPREAVTIGLPQLAAAGEVRLFADGGAWQRTALRKAVAGVRDPAYPVTLLTSSRRCQVFTDRQTAAPALD